ncbi:MAG: prepilin-type N-terminal cleavage/methylation domain-containing protein [Candidatus Parcubacteria bacterium]|nr:prepilin-type N-terminal cleavage/methylation domain-containing protein [Candidatus Parcubacteria bacterium]
MTQLLNRQQRLFSGLSKDKKGFTIIELVVTTSILVIITTLIFANYPKFRESISLKKTAQEIALTVRQAQTYGLGVREFQPGSRIFPGYGVHFDIDSSDSFVLFADGVSGNNTVESFKIQTGEKISDLCVKTVNTTSCGHNTIDIIFFRPNPLVTIKADGSSSGISDAEIIISSPAGQTKKVVILSSGQISVE